LLATTGKNDLFDAGFSLTLTAHTSVSNFIYFPDFGLKITSAYPFDGTSMLFSIILFYFFGAGGSGCSPILSILP
jgi:hypothetical protein